MLGRATEGGKTTITFTQVENNVMEANKPYYIVVTSTDDVDLSTDAAVTVAADNNGKWEVDGYEFKGTTTTIPNSSLASLRRVCIS